MTDGHEMEEQRRRAERRFDRYVARVQALTADEWERLADRGHAITGTSLESVVRNADLVARAVLLPAAASLLAGLRLPLLAGRDALLDLVDDLGDRIAGRELAVRGPLPRPGAAVADAAVIPAWPHASTEVERRALRAQMDALAAELAGRPERARRPVILGMVALVGQAHSDDDARRRLYAYVEPVIPWASLDDAPGAPLPRRGWGAAEGERPAGQRPAG